MTTAKKPHPYYKIILMILYDLRMISAHNAKIMDSLIMTGCVEDGL